MFQNKAISLEILTTSVVTVSIKFIDRSVISDRDVNVSDEWRMKRSKSYTWLSGLLRMKPDEEEWGAVPWVRAEVLQQDRSVLFKVALKLC